MKWRWREGPTALAGENSRRQRQLQWRAPYSHRRPVRRPVADKTEIVLELGAQRKLAAVNLATSVLQLRGVGGCCWSFPVEG